jgi:hypothetical protein
LIIRDASKPRWQAGLKSSSLIITDSLTARELPSSSAMRVFRIIADESLDELRDYMKRFMTG